MPLPSPFKRLCKVIFALLNESYMLSNISEEKMRPDGHLSGSLGRKRGQEEGNL